MEINLTNPNHRRNLLQADKPAFLDPNDIMFTVFSMTTEGEPLGHGLRYRGTDLFAAMAELLSHENVAYLEIHDGSCSLGDD